MNPPADIHHYGKPVLFDGWCGEPVAWLKRGDPVIGEGWGSDHSIPYTRQTNPAELVQNYGAITSLTLGLGRGFKLATYGEKNFSSRFADPRDYPDLLIDVPVKIDDPMTEHKDCPKCGAVAGQHCVGIDTLHRARRLAPWVSRLGDLA
jgi:hypothetical protein